MKIKRVFKYSAFALLASVFIGCTSTNHKLTMPKLDKEINNGLVNT